MKSGLAVAAIFITLCLQATGGAVMVTDADNDFLPTYTGPRNADVDVRSAEVVFNQAASTFSFSATESGPIGTTPDEEFVFGLNRGRGTERFQSMTPAIGEDIVFDSVVILHPNGTGEVADLLTGGTEALPAGSVKISGNTIGATGVPASLIPSEGSQPRNFTWDFWPRVGMGSNTQVTDFVPDTTNAVVSETAVPVALTIVCKVVSMGFVTVEQSFANPQTAFLTPAHSNHY